MMGRRVGPPLADPLGRAGPEGNDLAGHLGMKRCDLRSTILRLSPRLPEVSRGIQAVRLGAVGLAMSDIYGGNAGQLTLFPLADVLADSPVLPQASAESLWLGARAHSSPAS
jgi:cation:H+ antiporter